MQGFRIAFPCADISKFPSLWVSLSQLWNSRVHALGLVPLAPIMVPYN